MQRHAEVLEIDFEAAGTPNFEVSEEQVGLWSTDVVRRPVRTPLGPIEPFVARLAERLGKQVGPAHVATQSSISCENR